jgi:hypothetical protein
MNGEEWPRSCAPELDEETEDEIEHFFALEAMEDASSETEEQRQAAHAIGHAAIARAAELMAELDRDTTPAQPRTRQQ